MRWLRLAALSAALAILGFWGSLAQTGDYFRDYPGGITEATYRVTTGELASPIVLGWRVEPAPGGQLTVTTTNRVTAAPEDLETGVVGGVTRAQLVIQDEAVQALLENAESLRPRATFVLPGGARFVSAERETIQGVPVLCGMLTDPDRPDRRTFLAISGEPALPFPPYVQQEELGASGGVPSSFPVCRSLRTLTRPTAERFVVLFRLELTQLRHQP